MSKQVTLSKFFATRVPKSTDVKYVTDEDKSASAGNRQGNLTSKRKYSPKQSDGAQGSKKMCLDSNGVDITQPENKSPDKNSKNSDVSKSGTSSPSTSGIAKTTLQKLSQFSVDSDSDLSQSYTEIKEKKNRGSSSCSVVENEANTEAVITLDDSDDDDDENMDTEEDPKESKLSKFVKTKGKTKVSPLINPTTKTKYTPLEQQFVDIKRQYPDAVLFVECGYKYRFFGEDAEAAAKVLKIFAHPDHNFMTASIPTHRLFVHVRRLVSAGYKVGVVKQTETAALKAAGSNKSGPFGRKLTALYTKSTLIGEDVDPLSGIEESEGECTPAPDTHTSHYLMSVYDVPAGLSKSGKHLIGIVAVDPGTGDVTQDCFEDTDTRAELEKRITHIQPVEMLLPLTLSDKTEKLVDDVVALSSTEDDRIRLERISDDNFLYNQAFESVSNFYSGSCLQTVVNLPKPVICCLSALITYLKDFHLENALQLTSNFQEFSVKSEYMQLGGSTVRNLELFSNLTDSREKASLFWVMNHTVTKFGCRLLKSWINNPLMDVSAIRERQDAVEELCSGSLEAVVKLRDVMAKLPDLEKGLSSIYYRKCSTGEFYLVSKALEKMQLQVKKITNTLGDCIKSSLLKKIILEVPELLGDVKQYSGLVSEKAARENDKPNIFTDESKFPDIVKRKQEILEVQQKLKEHLRDVRLTVKQPALNYVTVLQTEFLVEVKNTQLKLVPSSWSKISSTKTVSRFHTPFIVSKYKLLNQLREQLVLDATAAWTGFLADFSEHYVQFKRGVQHLACLDCLLSLSILAQQSGYVRPEVVADVQCIEIYQGRHPVIDLLKGESQQFVPNDTQLKAKEERVMIITGPNMGGKSSYIRQVALIAIMSQIGSYVPAERARLGILDAIYTRMGAADEIFKGRSTFMVELEEASHIMMHATEKSLVILDELGRGTSTHDGVAIAHATLNFFIKQVQCLTLFVTHYPVLSEFEAQYPGVVGNYHMSFLVHNDDEENTDCDSVITFLYQLVKGAAAKSYGLNVARLASISSDIIKVATKKSAELEKVILLKREAMVLLSSCYGSEAEILTGVKSAGSSSS